jgi:hypothetical protein
LKSEVHVLERGLRQDDAEPGPDRGAASPALDDPPFRPQRHVAPVGGLDVAPALLAGHADPRHPLEVELDASRRGVHEPEERAVPAHALDAVHEARLVRDHVEARLEDERAGGRGDRRLGQERPRLGDGRPGADGEQGRAESGAENAVERGLHARRSVPHASS